MEHQTHRPATSDEALAELLAGNDRFVAGVRVHPHQDAERRAAVAAVQRPFAVIFGCSDSRLAAEIIFDRGLGDLFVVRTAGHVVGAEVLASVEYGVVVLGAPLVVVLGHDSCGAIAATLDAIDGNAPPSPGLHAIINRIRPSIRDAHADGITEPDLISGVHVRRTIETLTDQGTTLADRCTVVGMTYRLADGRVTVIAATPTRP